MTRRRDHRPAPAPRAPAAPPTEAGVLQPLSAAPAVQHADAWTALKAQLRDLFTLRDDTDYAGTLQQVRADTEFRSNHAWALVFAILIASVGLNVNSTAVIIGAMLISPLMGPIVGAGFGLATNDLQLLRRSVRNLLIAAGVALLTSTLYFTISPLEDVQSELLARTRPTLYDVLIALFGGGAGAVAGSRRTNKGNVVPGVAIATALMPPLCTAGFGLAQGNWTFFIGALHLFLINALFICLATLGFARLMHFERVVEVDDAHVTRVRMIIVALTLGIALPSTWTGWNVVQEVRFQQAARRFIAEHLNLPGRAVLNTDLRYARDGSTISATLLGQPLAPETIRTLEQQLADYGLSRTRLELNQPVGEQIPIEKIGQMVRQGILEDLYKRSEEALGSREERIRTLEAEVLRLRSGQYPVTDLARELPALYPELVSISVGQTIHTRPEPDTAASAAPAASTASAASATVAAAIPPQPTVMVVATWRTAPPVAQQERLRAFLQQRLKAEQLTLIHRTGR